MAPVGHIQPAEPSNPATTGFQNPFIKATDKKKQQLKLQIPTIFESIWSFFRPVLCL